MCIHQNKKNRSKQHPRDAIGHTAVTNFKPETLGVGGEEEELLTTDLIIAWGPVGTPQM